MFKKIVAGNFEKNMILSLFLFTNKGRYQMPLRDKRERKRERKKREIGTRSQDSSRNKKEKKERD